MIFDTNMSSGSTISLESVQESPYELGMGGALMHVYENQLNWNAIMKSVGISEMKYYQNTGRDLFVNEAGAVAGFIEKVKAFFKKVIEKIKQIFKAFMAKINSFIMSDKEFLNKYRADIRRKNVEDLEFKGRELWLKPLPTADFDYDSYSKVDVAENYTAPTDSKMSSDEFDKYKDVLRANFLKSHTKATSLDSSEFRDEVEEIFKGDDPEVFDVTSTHVSDALKIIEDAKDAIKKADKAQKDSEKGINNFIKKLESKQKEIGKSKSTGDEFEKENNQIHNIDQEIEAARCIADCNTVAYGVYVGALKDQNRQAKALCVKVLGYNKKESYYRESNIDDLFGSVQLV